MDIKDTLNELLVKLFRNINTIEEQAIRTEEYRDCLLYTSDAADE